MTSYYAHTSRRRRSAGSDWNMGADSIIDMVQRKPEALLLIGAGVALMMRRRRGLAFSTLGAGKGMADSRREWRDARSAMNEARETASEAAESVTEYASGMVQRMGDTASTYASSATRWADDAREGFMGRSQWLANLARTLPEELDEAVQDHPLVLAALGVAVGAALGATLPSTSFENRAMGETRDQLLDAAQGATNRLGEATEEAYEEALRTAESHGLSKEGLKEMARDVGGKFASAATGAAESGSPKDGGSSSAGASGSPGVRREDSRQS